MRFVTMANPTQPLTCSLSEYYQSMSMCTAMQRRSLILGSRGMFLMRFIYLNSFISFFSEYFHRQYSYHNKPMIMCTFIHNR